MAESEPVVVLPGVEVAPEDTVVLHEVVVEELAVEGKEGAGAGGGFEVAEPVEEEEEDVIVVEVVERVAEGPPRGGMATDSGIHPVAAVPVTDLPVEDVPPDETMTADMVADKSIADVEEEDNVKVEEVTVTEETVTVVTEAVADGESMETEAEKADKKRLRDEEDGDAAAVKKMKSEEEEKVVEPKKLGPKVFNSGVEMFTYFYNLLHDWNVNQNLNKYEFMVLTELVSQGNPQKVGAGVSAFQVRMHEKWQSRCYYLIREDGSEDDFSYRKCVDALMPLPKSLYRKNGELDLEKLFPGQKNRHRKEQNGHGGRGGDRGGHGRGGGGGGRGFHHGGGGRGHRGGGRGGGGGRRGGRGRW